MPDTSRHPWIIKRRCRPATAEALRPFLDDRRASVPSPAAEGHKVQQKRPRSSPDERCKALSLRDDRNAVRVTNAARF